MPLRSENYSQGKRLVPQANFTYTDEKFAGKIILDEINELKKDETELRLTDSLEELYNLRFQHAMHQLDNPKRLSEVRKDIARLKTVLHEYELGIRATKESAMDKEQVKEEKSK
ncbi:50S ribosomal protein L29 [candidate division KSB1 bacterium]|nr:50S ribosomal protein L29 [candidate division KSB1 bacterium]